MPVSCGSICIDRKSGNAGATTSCQSCLDIGEGAQSRGRRDAVEIGDERRRLVGKEADLPLDHRLSGEPARLIGVGPHGEMRTGRILRRQPGDVDGGGFERPELRGLDHPGVIAMDVAVAVEADGVRLEIGERVEPGADMRAGRDRPAS